MFNDLNNKISETIGDLKSKIQIQLDYEQPYKDNLVLSGGGAKGISHIGCFKALEDNNMLKQFNNFAGTSAGAFAMALLNIGYTPDELYQFLLKFDMSKITSISIGNFSHYKGFDSGIKMEYVIKRLITAKGLDEDVTLLELYKLTGKKMVFTTVCWDTADIVYLTHDTYPNMPVYLAIRMTISIPIYYTPVKFNGKLYLDGACIDNYPIKYFKDQLDRTVGVYLSEASSDSDSKDENKCDIETFIMRLIQIFFKANSYNNMKGFEQYTVAIELDYVSIIEFSLPKEKKEKMFQAGYDTTVKNLDKFK